MNGIITGSYSYLDATGTWQTVQYVAGTDVGFMIVNATNLNVEAVPETPEVAEARMRHLEMVQEALKSIAGRTDAPEESTEGAETEDPLVEEMSR